MEATTLFSVLMVRRAVESFNSSDTKTRAPLLTVRPANLQENNNKWVSVTKPPPQTGKKQGPVKNKHSATLKEKV